MSLIERIERQKPREIPEPTPIRQPEWIRRMQERGLPNVDTTARIYSDGCGPTGRAA